MNKLMEHPAFAEIERRISTGEYTTSYSQDWFIEIVKIHFKSGFCRGVKFEVEFGLSDKGPFIDTKVSTGFFSSAIYIPMPDLPTKIREDIIRIARGIMEGKNHAAMTKHVNEQVAALDRAF